MTAIQQTLHIVYNDDGAVRLISASHSEATHAARIIGASVCTYHLAAISPRIESDAPITEQAGA